MENQNLIDSQEFVQTLDVFHSQFQNAQLRIEDSSYHVEFWTKEQYNLHVNLPSIESQANPGLLRNSLDSNENPLYVTSDVKKPFKSGENSSVFKSADEFAAEVFSSGKKSIQLQEYQVREEQQTQKIDLSPWKSNPVAVSMEMVSMHQDELLEVLQEMTSPGDKLTLRSDDATHYISHSPDVNGLRAFHVQTVQDNGKVSNHISESAEELSKLLASESSKPVHLLSFENTADPILPSIDSEKADRVRELLNQLGPEEKLRIFYKNEKAMDIKRSGKAFIARQAAYPNTINLIGSGEQILATVMAVEGEAILAKDMVQWIHPLAEESLKTAIMRGEGIPGEDLTGKLEHAVEKYRFGKNGKFEYVAKGSQQVQSLTFQETPCMSPRTKSLMLDVADGKIQAPQLSQQTQGMAL